MSDHLGLVLIGVDGSRWDISGPDQGRQGVELLPKPKQFYDSPAITYWIKSGGAGQKYQGFSFKRRDPLFGLVIFGTPSEKEETESDLRRALGMYDKTFQIEAMTDRWGVRTLTMRLLEQPTAFESGDWEGKDPYLYEASTLMVSAACEQPHWVGEPVTASWTLESGTSGTGQILHPGNPGDVPIFPRWTLTAPAVWEEIPDPSWGQEIDFNRPPGSDTNRTYAVTPLFEGEDIELDTNADQPFMLTAEGGLGPWMRSNGTEIIYPVAAFTQPDAHEFDVTVSGAAPGATATIECDRWYSRPFGVAL